MLTLVVYVVWSNCTANPCNSVENYARPNAGTWPGTIGGKRRTSSPMLVLGGIRALANDHYLVRFCAELLKRHEKRIIFCLASACLIECLQREANASYTSPSPVFSRWGSMY